jgi:hypothetical protein
VVGLNLASGAPHHKAANIMILIGSEALRHYMPDRETLDCDIVSTYREAVAFAKTRGNVTACYPIAEGKKLYLKVNGRVVEAELIWPGNNTEKLVELINNDPDTFKNGDYVIPSLDVLFMLKMSHRYLKNSPHFLKTMNDIKAMRALGAKIRPEHEAFFREREKATYTYSHPKLNVSKGDFFKGDGVTYVYDHDSIHEAVKHLSTPAYQYFKPDQAEVFCDRDMFESVADSIRLCAVLEESYVLALERSQIPFKGTLTPRRSFDIALEKVCTSITSGWFREYAWENHERVQELYSDNYVDRFWNGVQNGIVKPFTGSTY